VWSEPTDELKAQAAWAEVAERRAKLEGAQRRHLMHAREPGAAPISSTFLAPRQDADVLSEVESELALASEHPDVEWKEHWSEDHGQTFYANTATSESIWTPPPGYRPAHAPDILHVDENGISRPAAGAGTEDCADNYRVVALAKVRVGFEQTSEEVCRLSVGVVVEALEGRLNTGGVMRIRTSRGWVNTKAADGTTLLLALDSHVDINPLSTGLESAHLPFEVEESVLAGPFTSDTETALEQTRGTFAAAQDIVPESKRAYPQQFSVSSLNPARADGMHTILRGPSQLPSEVNLFDEEDTEEHKGGLHEDITSMRWFHYTPVINILHDLLFDVAPSPEELNTSLNLFALITALMLTMVGPLPFSYGYDDWADAIARQGGDDELYQSFVKYASRSYLSLVCSLFTDCALLIALGHTSFVGPDGKTSTAMIKNFWAFARIPFMWVLFTGFCGIFWAFCAQHRLLSLMMPPTGSNFTKGLDAVGNDETVCSNDVCEQTYADLEDGGRLYEESGAGMLSPDVGVSLQSMMWVWACYVSLFVICVGFQSLALAMKTKTYTRARYNITVTDGGEKQDTRILPTLVAGTCCGPKSNLAVDDVSGEGLACAHCDSTIATLSLVLLCSLKIVET
jgi:hypothetical protein